LLQSARRTNGWSGIAPSSEAESYRSLLDQAAYLLLTSEFCVSRVGPPRVRIDEYRPYPSRHRNTRAARVGRRLRRYPTQRQSHE
jgi:hypothetical protein